MNPILLYWIEVNIALSLFYLSCATILRRDTFLQARRFFFLAAILFSFLYPFFPVQTISDFWISATESRGAEAGVWIEEPSMALLMEEGSGVSAMTVPWQKILFWIYSVVVLLLLSRFSGQLMSILRVRMKSVKRFVSGVPVYQLKEDIPPFSFFRWIFVHAESHTGAELKQILLHEQTHARQWHSMDIVLAELLCIFFWWNPFVWLMKREMAINLEYVADKNVLREGVDTREYQYHLLRLTYPGSAAFIVNNFNVSRLKQRIMMMNKTKSPALTLAKYLVIFPLAFLLVAVNSCTNQSKKSGEDAATESVAPASDEQDALPGDKTKDNTEEDAEVFVVVEEQPAFPGGNAALMKFLGDNIKYPVAAQENGIQGRVICNFIVEKDGRLTDFHVVQGVDPVLDSEAIRVLKTMPNWVPGKQRGEAVRVRYTLPVVFRLQN